MISGSAARLCRLLEQGSRPADAGSGDQYAGQLHRSFAQGGEYQTGEHEGRAAASTAARWRKRSLHGRRRFSAYSHD